GGADVLVGFQQIVRIGPGSYGAVARAPRGTLQLAPGEYDFCSLTASVPTNAPTAIHSRGNVSVLIQKDLNVGRDALIEPLAGTTQISVGGRVKIGAGSTIYQTIVRAPNARLGLGAGVTFDGALCVQRLKTARNVVLASPPPRATPTSPPPPAAPPPPLPLPPPKIGHPPKSTTSRSSGNCRSRGAASVVRYVR